MTPTIESLTALEILDSRGRPTLQVGLTLADGSTGTAQVPSGASTGSAEAHELRDGDPNRYAGLGCLTAVDRAQGEIASALKGRQVDSQQQLDQLLVEIDGTANKSNLGANAILGTSIAFARAVALHQGLPLYKYFANLIETPLQCLPRLTVNLFSGGKHAGGQVPLQDVLIVPVSARTISRGLQDVVAVYNASALLCETQYGMRRLTADEGGLAPPFPDVSQMFEDSISGIRSAGLLPGDDVALALDVASSHFFADGFYGLQDPPLAASEMITTLGGWARQYPIVSIEDGLAEDDWQNWPQLRETLAPTTLCLGDDLLCTNPARIQRAVDTGACDALLLKVNQIGTLSEAAAALDIARSAGWKITVSARSGETEDTWLADLAVGWAADQIKVGSITQSERLAKYNRLLAIEQETGLPVNAWPAS